MNNLNPTRFFTGRRSVWSALCRATCLTAAISLSSLFAQEVRLSVHPDQVVNPVDVKVYGHFLEHIYHSVNGGLWGELVWNRSFEELSGGQWRVQDGEIVQRGLGTNQRWVFGDPAWGDYEFTLQAQKTGGEEGFLILFRVQNEQDFYWCNLGGWGNQYHQLERGRSGEGRWHGVGPRVEGRIETDRWYDIRVRCEGTRFLVQLDGRTIIDWTDPAGHRTGSVGVGTWATQARFRNLKVTDLAGNVLYQGLPDSAHQSVSLKHWRFAGQGRLALEDEHPLNSRLAIWIEGADGESVLRQGPLALRRNEWYVGSLWVRGTAPLGMSVRLMDGAQPLAMQSIFAPGEDWREVPIRLRPHADTDNGTLEIALRGEGRVCLDQVSLMPESWAAAGGFRPDLLRAVNDLQPPLIRWPGGCFASAYRWKDGIGPQHQRRIYPRDIWDDQDVNSYGTDEFIAMCRKVGAEPMLVVNIGTPAWNSNPDPEEFMQDVLDWIEYCNGPADSKWGAVRAANGHPEPYGVKYWEIDNETWHMRAEPYAEAVRRYAPAMRGADPSIKLAACGSGGMGRDAHQWNRVVIEQCADLIDYLSIHHYEDPNRFAEGPRAYEAFFEQTGRMIADSKNPDLKLFVSEWNAQSTDWRTGLYCGGILNGFERTGNVVEIASPALFLRHVSATAWDNAFINFDHRTWFPAPNYVVMKLWREHYQPLRAALEGETGPLNVVATRSAEGETVVLKAVNPTDQTVTLTVAVAAEGFTRAAARQVAPGSLRARNSLEKPDAVVPVAAEVTRGPEGFRVTLPGYSATVIELGRE